jgi:hypothetical protein
MAPPACAPLPKHIARGVLCGVLSSVRPIVRAVTVTLVPEAIELDEAEWASFEQIVGDALAARPPALRRQLLMFVRLLEWLPLLRYGRRFTRLGTEPRRRFLERLQDAPVLLIRRGLWGLRTLLFMGYYARPAGARAVGYRADPRGWAARHPA